jgi:hypothetical protein
MAAEQLKALHATARHDEVVAARATPSVSAKNVAAGRKALEAQRLNVDGLLKKRVAIMKTRRAASTTTNDAVVVWRTPTS